MLIYTSWNLKIHGGLFFSLFSKWLNHIYSQNTNNHFLLYTFLPSTNEEAVSCVSDHQIEHWRIPFCCSNDSHHFFTLFKGRSVRSFFRSSILCRHSKRWSLKFVRCQSQSVSPGASSSSSAAGSTWFQWSSSRRQCKNR
jgi:hypothetical protein